MKKNYLLGLLTLAMSLAWFSTSNAQTQSITAAKNIKDGIYTNTITNKKNAHTFSVTVPESKEKGELKATTMTESVTPAQTFVSFGAGNNDLSYYRIDVMPINPKMPLFQIKDQLFNGIEKEASVFGGDMKKIKSGRITLDDHKGFYRVYTQKSPGVQLPADEETKKHSAAIAKPQTYTHSVFIANVNKYIVIFWFQGSDLGGSQNPYAITDSNRQKVVDFTWKPYAEFIKSFQITKHYRKLPASKKTAQATTTPITKDPTATASVKPTAKKAPQQMTDQSTSKTVQHGAAIDVETTDAKGHSMISKPERVYGVCRTKACMEKAKKKT